MVVVEIDGVVYDVLPVCKAVPPLEAAYQSIVSPDPGVAVIVTTPASQRLLFPAVGAVGNPFTVTVVVTVVVQPLPFVTA